jgi:hypothetical protein
MKTKNNKKYTHNVWKFSYIEYHHPKNPNLPKELIMDFPIGTQIDWMADGISKKIGNDVSAFHLEWITEIKK